MSSPNPQAPLTGGYDQSLLAAAPAATRAAKQEGYNVDLLDEGRHRSVPPTHTADLEAVRGGSKENFRSPVERAPIVPQKVPFWRTRRGIIGISVLAVVIVGAVVGGAVGGSVGKKNNNSQAVTSSSGAEPANFTQGLQPTNSSTSASGSPPNAGQQTMTASNSTASGTTSTSTTGNEPPPDTPANPDSQKGVASGAEGAPGGLASSLPTLLSDLVQNMQ